MVSVETYSLYCPIYIIPGCAFYLIFAFHLFTKKEFKTPFFGILKILAFVDLGALLLSCICLRTGYLLSQVSFLYTPRNMPSSLQQPPDPQQQQPPPGPNFQPLGPFPPPGPPGSFPPPGPQGSFPPEQPGLFSPPGPQGPNVLPPGPQPPGPPGQFPPPGPQGQPPGPQGQPPGPQGQPPGPQGQPPGPQGQRFQPQRLAPTGLPEPHDIFFRQPNVDYNIITTLLDYLMAVFGGIQACLHVILAFNRLTAILLPHGYRTLWRGKSFYGIVSIAFIIPAILYIWILYYGANVLMSPVFGSFVIDTLRVPIPWLHKATINTVIITITCVMTFAFDFATLILIQKRNIIKTDPNKYDRDLRLLTVSIAFFIVHLLFLATAVYVLITPLKDGMFLLIFLQTTIEIQSLISPFCVLIVNRNLRRDIFRRNSKTVTIKIQENRRSTF